MRPDDMNDEKFVAYYERHMLTYARIIGSNERIDDRPTIEQIKKFERDHGGRYDEITNPENT